jgi:DNA primase
LSLSTLAAKTFVWENDVWEETINSIKANVSLVDIIQHYTDVSPTRDPLMFKSLCPFHDDKNPSLQISNGKGLYHCFSCQAGGDSIGFVQEMEKISFRDAVEVIANRFPSAVVRQPYGQRRMSPENKRNYLKKVNMTNALQKASIFYSSKLMQVG